MFFFDTEDTPPLNNAKGEDSTRESIIHNLIVYNTATRQERE